MLTMASGSPPDTGVHTYARVEDRPVMKVRPFRAYRYAGAERDLDIIVAPPYDQVTRSSASDSPP